MMMKRIIALFMAVLSLILLVGCSDEDVEVANEVKFTVYENGETDMASFYMTSEINSVGKWKYEPTGNDIFEVFLENEEEKDFGDKEASYKTLIIKPKAEGETEIVFSLENGTEKAFTVKAKKNDSNALKLTVEEKK